MRGPLLSTWLELFNRLLKHYLLLPIYLVSFQRLKLSFYCPKHHITWTRLGRSLLDLKLESFMKTLFHGARRCYIIFQAREASNSPTQAMMSVKHNSDQSSINLSKYSVWHLNTLTVTSSPLSGLNTLSTRRKSCLILET